MEDRLMELMRTGGDDAIIDWLKNDKNRLQTELLVADLDARKGGKRRTYDANGFEMCLFENIVETAEELWNYEYEPGRSVAHVIFEPVIREIFAATFRDRVVQHWVINKVGEYIDNRLINDSYSCRKDRGTLYGAKRLDHHIRSVSQNFKIPTYVVKLDLKGYFMHINRALLRDMVLGWLKQQYQDNLGKEYRMLKHAITAIIMDDPIRGVRIEGDYEDWRKLPEDKSLFAQPPGQGLVIGNVTSQVFSNVYLDPLDRFIVFDLGWKHYGRYVDDFYIVVREDELPRVKRDIKAIENFLSGYYQKLNHKKTAIIPQENGVPFLGMVLKNGAILPGKRIKKNFVKSAYEVSYGLKDVDTITSYLGMLMHCDSDAVVEKTFQKVGWVHR